MPAKHSKRARVTTRMSRFLAVAAIASACQQTQSCDIALPQLHFGGGSCPSGSDVSPLTPNGLDLELTPAAVAWFPDDAELDVATGGSAAMTVLALDGTPLQFAYEASSEDSDAVAVSQTGSAVMLDGIAEGNACIDVADPETGELFGGLWVGASKLRDTVVVPGGSAHELIANAFSAFAFAAGDLQIGVGYLGGYAHSGPRIVDLGATLELDGAVQTDWQTLAFPSATVGSYTIAATVGSDSGSASFDVVDPATGAFEVLKFDDAIPDLACFAAMTTAT